MLGIAVIALAQVELAQCCVCICSPRSDTEGGDEMRHRILEPPFLQGAFTEVDVRDVIVVSHS